MSLPPRSPRRVELRCSSRLCRGPPASPATLRIILHAIPLPPRTLFTPTNTRLSFPDWDEEEAEGAGQSGTTKHLWEESWDDDDTTDDFSTQLREELSKVEAAKKR
jgi:hypothetical protein